MDIKERYTRLKEGLRTTTGRNVLTFFIFLVISTVFWFFMALNDEVQQNYQMPVQLIDFPDNVTIISGHSPSINVTVKDKGSALMKFSWGTIPTLKIRYDDMSRNRDNHLLLSEAQLNSELRGVFGTSSTIVAQRPDSLDYYYTTNPGIAVAVKLDCDIRTKPQFIAFGRPVVSADSVLLYSNSKERFEITSLTTVPIILSELNDTTSVEAKLEVPDGMRAIPSTIKVTIPVEPLVSKTRKIAIEPLNVPQGYHLVTFPGMIEVTYLLPKSLYNSDTFHMKAFVDYNDITAGSATLPVVMSTVPTYYRSVQCPTTAVEFVIEQE